MYYNDFTIVVPTRNSQKIANDFLINVLNQCDFNIILIDDFSDDNINYIENERISIIRNKTKQSLTKSWNQGVLLSKPNNVIICSHKSRPDNQNFIKTIQLLNEGFGLVGLGGFHFFGFNKYLLKKIGMFDENFKTGWYEDNDVLNKLFINNISYYLCEEIRDLKGPSSWEGLQVENKNYYFQKWEEINDLLVLKNQEKDNLISESINYDITYKEYKHTINLISGYKKFNKFKIL
jgi:hypothetical protein